MPVERRKCEKTSHDILNPTLTSLCHTSIWSNWHNFVFKRILKHLPKIKTQRQASQKKSRTGATTQKKSSLLKMSYIRSAVGPDHRQRTTPTPLPHLLALIGESADKFATGVGAEISAVILCAPSPHEVEVAAITGWTGGRGTRSCTGLPTAAPGIDAKRRRTGRFGRHVQPADGVDLRLNENGRDAPSTWPSRATPNYQPFPPSPQKGTIRP